jgi:transcriptional regulator with XRE-family HTH domain
MHSLSNVRFMNSGLDEKSAFAGRLHEVCTDKGLPAERGRQSALATLFNVSPNAARKWLLGTGLPELEVAIRLAKWGQVNLEWLLTGRGPKRGAIFETKAIVLGEAIEELPEADRQQALDFVRYKLERSSTALLSGERLARYMTMLDAFAKTPKPPTPPPKRK